MPFGHSLVAGLGFGDVVRLGTCIVGHSEQRLHVVGVAALALPGMLFEVDAIALRR